jgi:catechol 2,3-dioxygenase-like lactoylglutathione lyase family enzyme
MANPQLQILKLNHVNQVLVDYDGAIDFYKKVFGAKLTFDGREQFGPYNNCILYIGPVIVELFSPTNETGLGKIIARYGDTWQGLEFLTTNLDDALEAVRSRSLRIVDHNPDHWFFTLPSETHGLPLEIVANAFAEDNGVTNPFGITGLKNLSVAVRDLDAAIDFYTDLVADAGVVYREDRPEVNARAAGMNFGPETIEFMEPCGPGGLADYIEQYRPQIRGITLSVESLDQVSKHLVSCGIPAIAGDAPDTLAIAPEHNYNVLYQFTEA